MKTITKQLETRPKYKLKDDFERQKLELKKPILDFLKSQEADGIMACQFYDGDNIAVPSVKTYEYGDFAWNDAIIYCFEKYDIKLDPDFIKIALLA